MSNYDLLTVGTGLAVAVTAVASQLPRFMASIKRDKLDEKVADRQIGMVDSLQHVYEKQLEVLTDRINRMDHRINEMDITIHMQAVKVTRLIVVVIHMKALLASHSVPIPDHIQSEIDNLTMPPEEHKAT